MTYGSEPKFRHINMAHGVAEAHHRQKGNKIQHICKNLKNSKNKLNTGINKFRTAQS